MKVDFRYQTFGARFCAGIVDSLVFLPIGILHSILMQPERPLAVMVCGAVLANLGYITYSVLMHAKYGQTLGKMAAKVKVLSADEKGVPGFQRALLRDSVYIVLSVFALGRYLYLLFTDGFKLANSYGQVDTILDYASLAWVLLEFVTMLFNSRRRALHDLIAGTVVVNPPFLKDGKVTPALPAIP